MTNQKAQVSHALTLDSLLDHSLYIKDGHGHRGYSPIMKPRVGFAVAVWVFRNQMWGVGDLTVNCAAILKTQFQFFLLCHTLLATVLLATI